MKLESWKENDRSVMLLRVSEENLNFLCALGPISFPRNGFVVSVEPVVFQLKG